METYVIKKDSDLDKFKDEYGFKVYGNLHIECSLDFKGRLYVSGNLYIKAGGYIEAGEYIEAGGYHGISAGLSISCKGLLKYGLKCFAGICTWRDMADEDKTITCNKHEGGSIEYGILKETGIVDMTEEKEPKTKRVAVIWYGEVPKWWDDVETKNIEIVFRGHNNEEDYKEWSYVVEPVDMNRVSIETRESGAKIYHVDPPTPEPETVEQVMQRMPDPDTYCTDPDTVIDFYDDIRNWRKDLKAAMERSI